MGSSSALVIILVAAVALFGIGVAVYFLVFSQGNKARQDSDTMSGGFGSTSVRKRSSSQASQDLSKDDLIEMRKAQLKKRKKAVVTLEQKFFMAGMFSESDRREFYRMRIIIPLVLVPLLSYLMYTLMGLEWVVVGAIFGIFLGRQAPVSILDRRIIARGEEIMYYLPLVIEQLAIGVSSSLDIGPCIQRVVSMADERDTHNVVTELVKITQNYVRSGASLDDALTEVGVLSGHTELKHTFMSLAQVTKHGGEITKQLQELADAVASQRETKIEAKIKKLELAATGPVALVFAGFLTILLIGFGLQITTAF